MYWEIFGIVLVTLYFVLSLLFPKTANSTKEQQKHKDEDTKDKSDALLGKVREETSEKSGFASQELITEAPAEDDTCSSDAQRESPILQEVNTVLLKSDSSSLKIQETAGFSEDNVFAISQVASTTLNDAPTEPLKTNLICAPPTDAKKLSEVADDSVSTSKETQESLHNNSIDLDLHVDENEPNDEEMWKPVTSDEYPSKYLYKEFKNGNEGLPLGDVSVARISDSTDKTCENIDSREIQSTESQNLHSEDVTCADEVAKINSTDVSVMDASSNSQNNNNLEKFADGLATSAIETAVDNSVCLNNFAENLSEKIFWASADDVISEVNASIEKQREEGTLKPVKLESLSSNVASEVVNEAIGEAALREEYMSDNELDVVSPQKIQPHLGYVVENVVNNAICEAVLRLKKDEDEDIDDSHEPADSKDDLLCESKSHEVPALPESIAKTENHADASLQQELKYPNIEKQNETINYIGNDAILEQPEDQQSQHIHVTDQIPRDETQEIKLESSGHVSDFEEELSSKPSGSPTNNDSNEPLDYVCDEKEFDRPENEQSEFTTVENQTLEIESKGHVDARHIIDQERLPEEEDYSANESIISLPSESQLITHKEPDDSEEAESNRLEINDEKESEKVNKDEHEESYIVPEVDDDNKVEEKADHVLQQFNKVEHEESNIVPDVSGESKVEEKTDHVPPQQFNKVENEESNILPDVPCVPDVDESSKVEEKADRVPQQFNKVEHEESNIVPDVDGERKVEEKTDCVPPQQFNKAENEESYIVLPDVYDNKLELTEDTEHKADDLLGEVDRVESNNAPSVDDIKVETSEQAENKDDDISEQVNIDNTITSSMLQKESTEDVDDNTENQIEEDDIGTKTFIASEKESRVDLKDETTNQNESCSDSVSVPEIKLFTDENRSQSLSESEENILHPFPSTEQPNTVTLRDKVEDGKENFWRRSLILDLEEDFDLEESFSESEPGSPVSPKPIQQPLSNEGSEELSDSEEDEIIDHDVDAKLGAVGGSHTVTQNTAEDDFDFYDYGSDDDDDDEEDNAFEPVLTVDGLCISKQKEKGLARGNLKSVGSHYNRAIVLDNGCGCIKLGYAGDRVPRVNQQTVSGIPSRFSMQITGLGTNIRDFKKFGAEAVSKAGVMHLNHPMKPGMIDNWTDVEDIWEYMIYNELGAEVGDNPILMTEVSQNCKKNREKITEILFEHLNVPAMYLADQLPLSIYASGLTSGVCLSSGYSCSQAGVVYEGHTLAYTLQQLDIGGGDLTENLKVLLRDNRGKNFTTSSGWQIVNDIKETIAFVAKDYSNEVHKYKTNDALTKYYTLPDGQVIDIGYECMSSVEPLFQPDEMITADATTASQSPVHELVNNAIKRCDKDLQQMCHNHIILSGGTTLLKGFTSRLQHELHQINHRIRKIRTPEHRHYSPWIGGSILGSLSLFDEQYVTMDEYSDSGPRIVHKKCF